MLPAIFFVIVKGRPNCKPNKIFEATNEASL